MLDEYVAEAQPTARWVGANAEALFVVGAIVVATVGVVFRLWLAIGPFGVPDSDESVVGLMALRLLHHGELSTFYWGQPYGGSLEAVLVMPFVALFGTTPLGLRAVSVVLGLATSVLTWRIARHWFRPTIAALAGILSLFWPAYTVLFGTRERGFYPLTAALGLAAVLVAIKIDERPHVAGRWFALGGLVGAGVWMSPNIAYYAVPIALWLAWRGHWKAPRPVLIAAAGALVGGSAWLYTNLHSGFASVAPPAWAGSSTYVSRFGFFWSHALPFAFGLRRPGEAWATSVGVGIGLCILASAVLVAALLTQTGRRLSLDAVLLGAAPFMFAAFPANWRLLEGRYVFFLASLMPLAMARMMTLRVGRVVVAVVAVVTSIAFWHDVARLQRHGPPSTAPITRELRDGGYRTSIAGYWVAYQLTFASDEGIIATPTVHARYGPYVDRVRRSAPAYVFRFADGRTADAWLIAELQAARVPYRVVKAGGYYAVLPARRYLTTHPVR